MVIPGSIKFGFRRGDAAPLSIIEFTGVSEEADGQEAAQEAGVRAATSGPTGARQHRRVRARRAECWLSAITESQLFVAAG